MRIKRTRWHYRYYCFLKSWWESDNYGYMFWREKCVRSSLFNMGKTWVEYPVQYDFVPASPLSYLGMILVVGTFMWAYFALLFIPVLISGLFRSGSVEVVDDGH